MSTSTSSFSIMTTWPAPTPPSWKGCMLAPKLATTLPATSRRSALDPSPTLQLAGAATALNQVALADQGIFEFATAAVTGRTGSVVHTDRGDISSPLIVDGLGWRRVLGAGQNVQPPDALLSRGLEVHPFGSGQDMEIWIDRSYVPAGYGWSFPADGELRIGVGSFDPRFHVREPTIRLATDLRAQTVRYQGNWIPHALRDATA